MEEQVYVAPANFKGGRLIFGMYHISDLVVLGAGTLITIIGCIVCFNNLSGTALLIGIGVFAFIGGLCWLLTTKYSVYHNIMGFLIEWIDYLMSEKDYIFEGIIYYDEEKESKK